MNRTRKERKNMNRAIHFLVAACLLIPASSSAAMAASRPTVDCQSAARDPAMPYEEYVRLSREACYGGATRDEGSTAWERRVAVSAVDFTDVPTWSDADIKAQFIATRDKRYLNDNSNPVGPRRIPWMYTNDGCYARADQVRHLVVTDGGKTAPYKLFAFAPLRVYSDNAIDGKQTWGYHVVPIVKNSAGQPVVFDAALNPCQTLPWKDWLALMVDDMSVYDKWLDGNGVTLGDPNAYGRGDPAIDGPDNDQRSLDDLQNWALTAEWTRQTILGRNVTDVLGDHPPWGKGVCVSLVGKELSLAGSAIGSVAVSCPTGSMPVGGGYGPYPGSQLFLFSSLLQSNGWSVSALNTQTSGTVLDAYAVCLSGSTGTVSSVASSVSIAKRVSGSTYSSCPSGSVLTGGGFSVPSDQSVIVYKDWWRSGSTRSWDGAGSNSSGTSKTLKSYAICLSGTNATTQPVSAPNTILGGSGTSGGGSVSCTPGTFTTGGGWSASGANQKSYDSSMNPKLDGWSAYAFNSTSNPQTFTTGAMCLSFNTVNDTSSGITYSGSWGYSSGRDLNDYMNDVRYTTTNGDYFQYTFTGTGVDYITEKNSDEGNVDIYIDNKLQTPAVNCNNSTRLGQQVVYSKKSLSSGSHTIKAVKKSGTYMLLDALAIYQ